MLRSSSDTLARFTRDLTAEARANRLEPVRCRDNEISRVIRDPSMPETTRTAGLTLIGWLARRLPGELPHAIGIPEARESERRIKAARQKLR